MNFYVDKINQTLKLTHKIYLYLFRYIKEMKEQPNVFSIDNIFLIFSNMEQIYQLQQSFLEALRLAIPKDRIAEVFLEFQSAFMVYSQYCNSYPRALMELENISGNKEAIAHLEK